MDEKTKELIAVGASVGAHCQPCLSYHVGKAKELGIDGTEIREAMDIGHMVEKGAMAEMLKWATEAMQGGSMGPMALPLAFLLGLVSAVASACCTLPAMGMLVTF